MAARWSGSPVDFNTENRGFMDIDSPDQVMGDHAESVDIDRSILALFEDSTVESEGKNGADEDGAALLSALTEMLDNVAEEDDKALSPFDTLPDTKLISITERSDESLVKELSPAHRLRPRSKPTNTALTLGGDGEKEPRCRSDKKAVKFAAKTKKREAKVEVFSSSSLVSLVKLMHSYCLKLHVEDGDEQEMGPTLFSQEEVWKYERPSEECDEEINVVSDDETKEEDHAEGRGDDGLKRLKSALLNGNVSKASPSKEKKRVSFGSVQVTSFEESEGNDANEKNGANETDPEPPTISVEGSASKAEKVETKGKSLSLQQYRQLRQRRRPLLEKQGNYTTKWPSVSVPPKELTPILCLQGQLGNTSPTMHHHPNSHRADDHSSHHGSPTRQSKPPKPESKSLKSFISVTPKSPAKRPVVLCSDPPNPVLLPLPQSSASSSSPVESSAEPRHPQARRSPHNCNQSMAAAPQEIKTTFTHTGITSVPSAPMESVSEPHKCSTNPKTPLSPHPGSPKTGSSSELLSQPPLPPPTPTSHTSASEEALSPPHEPSPPQNSRGDDRTATDSGIEACDLTSLLEQFEETQAMEARVCDQTELVPSCSRRSESNSRSPSFMEATHALSTPETSPTPITPQHPQDLQALEHVVVPEPLCSETIQTSQQDQPRRTLPPSKAIQIIDPRPLPSRRTHTSPSESPAARPPPHVFFYLSSEHDYCEPAAPQQNWTRASSPASSEQSSRSLPEFSTEESLQLPGVVCKKQMPPCSLPTPPPSPPVRGREKRRYRSRSPRSESSSSSCSSSSSSSCSSASRSPKRPRRHRRRSHSSSCSSSPSSLHSPPRRNRLSYSKSRSSRSRSRSWSQSRSPSRSPSPFACRRRWRDVCSSRESRKLRRENELRMQKLKAIDERRVVYVGRIRTAMTHEELRERFAQFGVVECVSLHFRDKGDHYGFVTFYNTEDAFAAIDNGSKLRKPDELPFDICFGGRRQFCNSNYADLDDNRDPDQAPSKSRINELDFDSLLKQAQRGMKR